MTVSATHGGLITALQAINGAGGYSQNVSGTGRVVRRAPEIDPPFLPILYVELAAAGEVDGQQLTQFEDRGTFRIVGLVGASSDTPDARIAAAVAFLDDIRKALRADRSLGNVVNDVGPVSGTAFDGAELQAGPTAGIVYAEVSPVWWEDAP